MLNHILNYLELSEKYKFIVQNSITELYDNTEMFWMECIRKHRRDLIEQMNYSNISKCHLELATELNDIHTLKLLVKKKRRGLYMTKDISNIAIKNGNLDMLKYLYSIQCNFDTFAATRARKYGNADAELWLKSKGYHVYYFLIKCTIYLRQMNKTSLPHSHIKKVIAP